MAKESSHNFDIVGFGKLLRLKRKELKHTAEALSEQCALCDRTLRNVELGKTMPKLDTAMRIMKALNITLDMLSQYISESELSQNE